MRIARIVLPVCLAASVLVSCGSGGSGPTASTYTLTVAVTGDGTVDVRPDLHAYPPGDEVVLEAVPDLPWQFDHWEGDLAGNGNPATLAMNGNLAVTAVFSECPLPSVRGMTVLDNSGGRVGFSPDGRKIAYDKVGTDGYIDVWIMNADGTERVDLTDGVAGLPGRHMGNPDWHPSGDWIVFQAEKAVHPGGSALATPGLGRHNDLWVIRVDGSESYRLTDIGEGLSLLHPHFSFDGSQLVWGESTDTVADWVVKIADWVAESGDVRLENTQTLRPGDPPYAVWYETHGFTPDGGAIVFAADLEPGQDWTGCDIYTCDLTTGEVRNLTNTLVDWDEHGLISPDGRWIAWMSSTGHVFDPGDLTTLRADYWIMRSDGSQKQRLTWFNDPAHSEYHEEGTVCGDCAWSPDSSRLATRVMVGDRGNRSEVVILHLSDAPHAWTQDDSYRSLLRRGCVTLTNNCDYPANPLGDPLVHTSADYERLRSWGTNVQQIRLACTEAGIWPGHSASPDYLGRVDDMIELGKQAGIDAILKLTFYDVPSTGLGPDDDDWRAFWENGSGEWEHVVQAWTVLWQRYVDEPAVLGYDLLNEPRKGSLPVSDETFIADYLTPLYGQFIDALRQVDARRIAFFQPPLDSVAGPPFYADYTTPIPRTDGVVYAPHFYPNFTGLDTSAYAAEMDRLYRESVFHGVPLFIGEYHGPPWNPSNDGNTALEALFQETEKEASRLLDIYRAGATRPWFADDRAMWGQAGSSLIRGTTGLDGPERSFFVDVLARPQPRCLAGLPRSFGFDSDTLTFHLTLTPSFYNGDSVVFVPRTRHYASGFRVRYLGTLEMVHDAAEPSGLRVTANPDGLDTSGFSWDESNSTLVISRWACLPGDQTLEIEPA